MTRLVLPLLVLLIGCGDLDQLPLRSPPLAVYMSLDVPASDAERFDAAIRDWNRVAGSEVLYRVQDRLEADVVVRPAPCADPRALACRSPAERLDHTDMIDRVSYLEPDCAAH